MSIFEWPFYVGFTESVRYFFGRSPSITHLIITQIWIQHGHVHTVQPASKEPVVRCDVVAPILFFNMEFYKGMLGK